MLTLTYPLMLSTVLTFALVLLRSPKVAAHDFLIFSGLVDDG